MMVSARLAHRRDAPGADRSGHYADRTEYIESAPFKILAGDVFKRLPPRPKIHAIADFRIARDGAHFRIQEVWHQSLDCIRRYHSVGINADEDLLVSEV